MAEGLRKEYAVQQQELDKHLSSDNHYQFGPARMRVRKRVNQVPSQVDEIDVANPIDKPQVYQWKTWFEAGYGNVMVYNKYEVPANSYTWTYIANYGHFPRPTLYVDWMEVEDWGIITIMSCLIMAAMIIRKVYLLRSIVFMSQR
ncbi:MAG: hypothetical protein CMJ78_07960 [Planctomycetaceae bacterium]|nr:hypothetical protein [Planctomycetaceae bacterium]